jgi:hypothetical protein
MMLSMFYVLMWLTAGACDLCDAALCLNVFQASGDAPAQKRTALKLRLHPVW